MPLACATSTGLRRTRSRACIRPRWPGCAAWIDGAQAASRGAAYTDAMGAWNHVLWIAGTVVAVLLALAGALFAAMTWWLNHLPRD